MNRPLCLIGGMQVAEQWVVANYGEEEFLEFKEELSMEDIKSLQGFLLKEGLRPKKAVIYYFNKLNDAKQSVFLKVFEELPDFSSVVLHSTSFVNFTIQTRCDLLFLSSEDSSADMTWLFDSFKESLLSKSLNRKKKEGFYVYLETLNLYRNGYLTEEEKNYILNDLK